MAGVLLLEQDLSTEHLTMPTAGCRNEKLNCDPLPHRNTQTMRPAGYFCTITLHKYYV